MREIYCQPVKFQVHIKVEQVEKAVRLRLLRCIYSSTSLFSQIYLLYNSLSHDLKK